MKESILNARIERNGFRRVAGQYFRGQDSEIILMFKFKGINAFVGIQESEKRFTVIADDGIYYSDNDASVHKIEFELFLDKLKDVAMSEGKTGSIERLTISETNSIWLCNMEVVSAIWNTVMMFENR